jgi:hypothetical protein
VGLLVDLLHALTACVLNGMAGRVETTEPLCGLLPLSILTFDVRRGAVLSITQARSSLIANRLNGGNHVESTAYVDSLAAGRI